jgi:hypothetical protein
MTKAVSAIRWETDFSSVPVKRGAILRKYGDSTVRSPDGSILSAVWKTAMIDTQYLKYDLNPAVVLAEEG